MAEFLLQTPAIQEDLHALLLHLHRLIENLSFGEGT